MTDATPTRNSATAMPAAGVTTEAAAPRRAKDVIAKAELPEPLASIIRTTVRRTRLRRRERLEIAAELVGHMHDGLESGSTPEQLAERFGDPRTAGRLMRIAARRRRSRIDRAFSRTVRLTGGLLAAALVAYAIAAVRVSMLEPTLTFDAYARMNALVPAVDDDDRAWPHYRDALTWQRDIKRDAPAAAPRVGVAIISDPGSEAAERDALHLRAHADELAALRRAASRPRFGWRFTAALAPEDEAWFDLEPRRSHPGIPSTMLMASHWPVFGALADARTLLHADARFAAGESDGERLTADLVALLGVSSHAGESRTIIGQSLEASGIEAVTAIIREVLAESPDTLTDQQLAVLAASLDGIPSSARHLDLAAARIGIEDVVQHVYSNDGEGDGTLIASRATQLREAIGIFGVEEDGSATPGPGHLATFARGPEMSTRAASRRETLHLADTLWWMFTGEQSMPLATRTARFDSEIARQMLTPGAEIRHPILLHLIPAVGHLESQRVRAGLRIDASRVAIALEQWRRRHGAWPVTLEELVPNWIAEVPRDVWSGGRVQYRLDDDGYPRLWATGRDGEDDGGRAWVEPPRGITIRDDRHPQFEGDDILIGRVDPPED